MQSDITFWNIQTLFLLQIKQKKSVLKNIKLNLNNSPRRAGGRPYRNFKKITLIFLNHQTIFFHFNDGEYTRPVVCVKASIFRFQVRVKILFD